MMEREIILTSDGSHTVQIKDLNVTYHSHHGALQESRHVFIKAGLLYLIEQAKQASMPIQIFEMGFGTGLNALLTLLEAETRNQSVCYTTIESYPLLIDETALLNYSELLSVTPELLQQLHAADWGKEVLITSCFTLKKIQDDLVRFTASQQYNLIYYDAFAPAAQPELWTAEIFQKLYQMLLPEGVLVTYCSKGDVRRAMKAAGFIVEKIPGPAGKREMLRAVR